MDWKIKRIYDELDSSIFKKTEIYVTLRAKKVNTDLVKWFPYNSKGESELILATIKYDRFTTDFYMIQAPKVKGLKLYEFNPVGSNFSQVQKIEFSAIEKQKTYWMLTEEKTIPSYQNWWKSAELTDKNKEELGIKIESEQYLGKTSYILQDQSSIIKREGKGLFSEISKMAMRADVEIGTNTSSFYLSPDDEEIFTGNRYLTILDEFSIDNDGYITLGTSKVVSKDGMVQYDFNKNLSSRIGGSFVDLTSTPITKSVTTYINGVNKATSVSSNRLAESARVANLKKNTAYTMTSAEVPKAIATTTSTDSRLINTANLELGQGASKYWVSDSTILGQFVSDTKGLKTSDVSSVVGGSLLDNEYATNRYFDSREKQDIVISYIAEDGTIRYTSKEEGISVKVVTDAEGKLVKEPRKIWDNLKLRPVIISFEESPNDVNPILADPITFYRVSEAELDLDFSTDSWRNMVTRAQVTYEVLKKGQDPFIQIIEKIKNDDIKAWRFKDGRLERYIIRGGSININTSYIDRKPFIVRSNCPFKLTFKYNTGFENTLAFDKVTEQMSDYTISNDSQTLYSKKYNSVYGKGMYMNILEADETGVIGKIVATYNDYSAETTVNAQGISGNESAQLVDKDGVIDKAEISRLILVNRGKAKNIFAYSRRTLHHMFTSFTDVEDVENLKTITTSDKYRNSLIFKSKSQHLRVSAANPDFNEKGYLNHKITLDIERTKGRAPKFPISPLGQLSELPYNSSHSYNRNSAKGIQYYIYENGQEPKLTIQSNPGALGGTSVDLEADLTKYKSASIAGVKYTLSPWGSKDINYREVSNDYIPVRWESTNTGATTYYTLPGAKMINKVPIYNDGHTLGLEDNLYTCVENPSYWTKLDMTRVEISRPTVTELKVRTNKSINLIISCKEVLSNCLLDEHFIESSGDTVNTSSTLYKVSPW